MNFLFVLHVFQTSLSLSLRPPDQNFGLDYHTFQHMVGDCPPDFLQLAFNCCNVSPVYNLIFLNFRNNKTLKQDSNNPSSVCEASGCSKGSVSKFFPTI